MVVFSFNSTIVISMDDSGKSHIFTEAHPLNETQGTKKIHLYVFNISPDASNFPEVRVNEQDENKQI